MKHITVYSPSELKAKFPEAFEKAHSRFSDDQNDIPWTDEIMESLKGLFKATSGVTLRDWHIGAYSYSYIKLSWDYEEVRNFSGNRAMAWLENNLLSDLRIKANTKNHYQYHTSYRSCDDYHIEHWGKICRPYTIGMIPPCPFTGYCADDDYLESLQKDIREGMTLGDAFLALADVARHLFEQELEYMTSEEYFLEQEHLQYTKEGRLI